MCRIVAIMLLLEFIIPASAHLIYVEYPQWISAGSETSIFIAYGHGETADSNQLNLTVANLISPDGDETFLELEPHDGGLKGTVSPDMPGCYLIDLKADASFFDPSWLGISGSRTLLEKYCRALLPVESGKGFDWFRGDGLEIVPEVDPYGMKSGEIFRARALWDGKPVDGSYTAVVIRSPDDVLQIQHAMETDVEGTTSDGEINFSLTRPGLWVLTFETTFDEAGTWIAKNDDSNGRYRKGDKLEYEQIASTAYLNFWATL